MFDILCQLDLDRTQSIHHLRAIIHLMLDLPSFNPTRYDLSHHESWRTFDPEKVCIDALSQRIDLIRIQGTSPSQLAMITNGSPDIPPMFMVSFPEDNLSATSLQDILLRPLPTLPPFKWLAVTSSSWKTSCSSSPLLSGTSSRIPLAVTLAIPQTHTPTSLQQLKLATPITTRTVEPNINLWTLAPQQTLESDDHERSIQAIYNTL